MGALSLQWKVTCELTLTPMDVCSPYVQPGEWTFCICDCWTKKSYYVIHATHNPCWCSFRWIPCKWRGICCGRTFDGCDFAGWYMKVRSAASQRPQYLLRFLPHRWNFRGSLKEVAETDFFGGGAQRWSRSAHAASAGREYECVYSGRCQDADEPTYVKCCAPCHWLLVPETQRNRRICCLCAPSSRPWCSLRAIMHTCTATYELMSQKIRTVA